MSPPIYTPDGSEVSEIVLPDGSTASQVIGPDGNVVFEAGPDIPDTQLFRNDDSVSASVSDQRGVIINPNVELDGIKASVSNLTSDVTRAYIFEMDETIVAATDVTGLTAGDTFQIDGAALNAGTDYGVALDAEGATWTLGSTEGGNGGFPVSGAAFDLVGGYFRGDNFTNAYAVNNIRNLQY